MSRNRVVLWAVLFSGFLTAMISTTATLAEGSRGVTVKLKASEAVNAADAGEVRLYESSHALVIGIDAYRDRAWPRLSRAVSDAQAVAKVLEAQGFDVTLKTDLDSVGLSRTLKDFFIRKGRDANSRLFVWFAGHGHTLNGEGFLIPSDGVSPSDEVGFLSTAVSLRDFGKFVRYAKSKHAYAVFDSCFAGTVFNVARSRTPPAITRVTTEPVRQFLSSGDAGQKVSDDGRFARMFVEALEGRRRADANTDGYLTASEMGAYLTYEIANLSDNVQTPRYGKLMSAQFDRGDFVFVLPKQEAAALATPAPQGGGFSLDDLRRQQEVRAGWNQWQSAMQSAFNQTKAFVGGADLRKQAWGRFLATYGQDNPFSSKDEELRAEAKRLEASLRPPDFQAGVAAYMIGDYATALREFEPLVKQGNAEAQYLLGSMYEIGQGVQQDDAEAVKWYRKAADRGDADAQVNLGSMYVRGSGVPQDDSEAVKWFRKAADQGHADGQLMLGVHYRGKGIKQDYAEAARWFRKAAEQGNALAQNKLGFMYDKGQGVPQDMAEAVKWYRKAADRGDADAQFNLGFMYDKGQGVQQDYTEAIKWFRKSADQGGAKAQGSLGLRYVKGQGVPQDDAEAAKWFRKAADQGDVHAQRFLGLMYEKGRGVQHDDAEAVKWFRKAADQGNAAAQTKLGLKYVKGQGVPQDDSEAAKWFRKAADQGDADAQGNLGIMYERGEGVPQDDAEAMKWYRKAADQGLGYAQRKLTFIDDRQARAEELKELKWRAEQGNIRAQLDLGLMYVRGSGVPQDDAEAAKWFRKAADQGNAYAQGNLGFMYANGQGVPQDYAEAVKWYHKAADQGDAIAQGSLGHHYSNGLGVPEDQDKAVKWFRLASEQGQEHSQVSLGWAYFIGEGIEQDYLKAIEWNKKAADLGHPTAMSNLGLMYLSGLGVPRDYKKVLKFYRKAAEHWKRRSIIPAIKAEIETYGAGAPTKFLEVAQLFLEAVENADADALERLQQLDEGAIADDEALREKATPLKVAQDEMAAVRPAPDPTDQIAPTAPTLGAASDPADIVILAKSDSWIQVRDGIARKLLVTRLLRAGDSYAVPDRPGLTLLTGNAGALEILVGGKAVAPIGGVGAVRRNVALDAERLRAGTAVID